MCERVHGVCGVHHKHHRHHKLSLDYFLIVKSYEISAWNEMCERVRGVCGVFKDTTDTTDTTNSLATMRCVREFVMSVVSLKTPQTPQTPWTLLHISFHAKILQDLTNRQLPADRGDQELFKTFHGLKIGPLLRELQAFKDWQFFDFY